MATQLYIHFEKYIGKVILLANDSYLYGGELKDVKEGELFIDCSNNVVSPEMDFIIGKIGLPKELVSCYWLFVDEASVLIDNLLGYYFLYLTDKSVVEGVVTEIIDTKFSTVKSEVKEGGSYYKVDTSKHVKISNVNLVSKLSFTGAVEGAPVSEIKSAPLWLGAYIENHPEIYKVDYNS
ncbi:hypothetical protein [Pseudomonas sp. S1_E04]